MTLGASSGPAAFITRWRRIARQWWTVVDLLAATTTPSAIRTHRVAVTRASARARSRSIAPSRGGSCCPGDGGRGTVLGAMHIRQVAIENIRRFGSGAAGIDLSLPPRGWIVVAGPNGSGKTTFLQVLALALSNWFPQTYVDTMSSWQRRGSKAARSRLILVPSTEDEFQAEVGVYSAKAAKEELVIGDAWKITNRGVVHGRRTDEHRALAGPWHAEPKGWFAAGYGATRRLSGQASAAEGWSSATTREGAFLTLFRDDAALVHPIRWLMDLHHRSLDPQARAAEREDARRIVDNVIALLNDGLLGDTKVLGVDSYGLSVEQGGQKLAIHNLGAGAQVLAALVVDVLRHMHARFGSLRFTQHQHRPVVKHGGVVLIDEVEAHLHPAWQRRIGSWLQEHFPEVQFIVTTHSPFVCQATSEKGLILLPAPGSAGSARIAEDSLYNRVVNGSVDDALLSDLFGLEHTWSEEAERKRAHLAALEARVLTGKAKPKERAEYRSLLAKLPQTMSDEVERVAARLSSSPAVGQKR